MSINLNVTGNTQPLEAAVNAAINRIRKTPIKITVDDKGATQPLGNMKRGADEFSKSMEAANSRIIAFGASMAIINGVADGFKALVKNVVEVEKALADINVVMNLSTANLEKFSNGLFKTAKETGAAFNVAAEAATEYARQGLTMEESLKRTRDALILTRLTGMDSANAVKALTAAMNTYGDQIKDTTQLVSKFAAVDVKFAVSAEDFADAISRTGQAAKSAGVDIDELVGLVTAAQQQTARGGKVIGNSFKTIFTRIGRSDTLNQLENLGIAVRDLEGNTLGAKRILTDLANTFDKLTASQQNQIAQTVGGVFQINVLKAVLSDAAKQNGILANATQISSGATTEAIDKNDQLRQTMSAMATETGLALKELSAQIGEIMLAPGMEKVLNVFKGLAEGANEMLGGGESTGSDFAQGFLKGLGNIITGPGLVVISAVFIKLFAKALVYANQSLRSLIGVTSEAHKQKAIQTSLVTLFGQNAAISKEMLRTDISRTEKERIILGLLKAQVIEANMLNSVSKSVAGGLYTRGYNANLTPRKRGAEGYIPNFADPERAQAARGGYAAGTIRSMNMPGEGSVIYNSAEKVKNFKGMSQPAIMPPHSSKAGKNYQQAFGDVHGFDPYAAGGYIPNFAQTYNADSKMVLFSGSARDGGGYTGSDRKKNIIYINPSAKSGDKKFSATKKTGMKAVNVPYFTIGKDDKEREANDPKIKNKIQGDLIKQAQKTSNQLVNSLFKMPSIPSVITSSDVAVASGKIFEKIIMSVQKGVAKEAYGAEPPGNALLDIPRPGRDALWDLFGAGPLGSLGAEAKIALGSGGDAAHLKSAAEKFYKIDSLGKPEDMALKRAKAFAPAGKLNLSLTSDLAGSTKVQNELGAPTVRKAYSKFGKLSDAGKFDLLSRYKSYGHIPNFADPLSDAIGREKAAGVPVSQIRVGSHPALMGKSNPIGLGVTNTHDEPNGLRDVIGAANGFVPNYFNPIEKAKTAIGESGFGKNWKKATTERTKAIKIETDRIKSRTKAIEAHRQELTTLTQGTREHADVERKIRTTTQNLDKATQKKTALLNSPAPGVGGKMGRFSQGLGGAFSGNKGMMMMMGAPMAAGFLQSDGPGGAAYNAGGALTGAASGAIMASMAAPMFGPGAPLVIAMGGLLGGLKGYSDAQEENTKALKEAERERKRLVISSFAGADPKFMQKFSKNIFKDLSPEGKSVMKMAAPKFTATKPAEVSAKDIFTRGANNPIAKMGIPFFSPMFSPNEEERSQATKYREQMGQQSKFQKVQEFQTSSMKKALRSMGDQEFLLPNYEKDKSGKIQTKGGPELKKASEYLDNLEKIGFFEAKKVGDSERIEGLRSRLYEIYQADLVKEKDRSEGIIVQLDFQKAQMVAQQAAAVKQLEIKDRYSEISENLKFEVMLMGGLMTDKQKAENKYLQAINKSAEAYEKSAASADAQLRTGLLNQIKGDQGVQGLVKTSLGLKEGSSFQDISEQVGSLSGKGLENKLREIADEETTEQPMRQAILELLSFEVEKRQNILDIAEKTKTNSTGQATREREINNILAGRSQIIKDLERKNRMSSEALQSSQKIRGFTEQVAAAKRLNAVGPGYQTNRERENFVINEKRFGLESQITTLKENQKKSIGEQELAKTKVEDVDLKRLNQLTRIKDEGFISKEEFRELETLVAATKERAKKLEEIEQKIKNINSETDSEINKAKTLLEKEKERLEIKRKHETGPGAFGRGFRDTAKEMGDTVETFNHKLGNTVAVNFRDGIAEAMKVGLNGADDLGDALMNIAGNFLSAIQDAFLQNAANAIVSKIPMPSGNYTGGAIRNYSRGGGVPAMVSDGEYVMNSKAVNKYGGSFMHGLNAGGNIPGFSEGGAAPGSALAANFGGGRGVASGRSYQSKAMSGFFYSQSGNVGIGEDKDLLLGELAAEEEARRAAAAKKAKKKALWRQLIGTVLSAGISYGVSGGFSGGGARMGMGNETLNRMPESAFNFDGNPVLDGMATQLGNPYGRYNGGPIRKYASGGHIAGKSGIDQIPAMLSEGEYVIRSSSARQIGKPMLDRINAGKFNDGGSVSPINSSSESATSGGSTNNINISINMGGEKFKGGSNSEDSNQNSADKSSEHQKSLKLGEKVKQQVISVIVEEKRPGGLLAG